MTGERKREGSEKELEGGRKRGKGKRKNLYKNMPSTFIRLC